MALQSRLPVLLGRHSNTKQANQIVPFARLFSLMDIGHLVTEDCANRPKRHLMKKTPLIKSRIAIFRLRSSIAIQPHRACLRILAKSYDFLE